MKNIHTYVFCVKCQFCFDSQNLFHLARVRKESLISCDTDEIECAWIFIYLRVTHVKLFSTPLKSNFTRWTYSTNKRKLIKSGMKAENISLVYQLKSKINRHHHSCGVNVFNFPFKFLHIRLHHELTSFQQII